MYKRKRYKNAQLNVMFLVLIICSILLISCGGHVRHVVKKGETLYSIGWKHKQDYRLIAQWNNIPAPYHIQEGQWLRVAPPNTSQSTVPKKELTKPRIVSKAAKSVNVQKTIPPKPINRTSQQVTRFTDEKVRSWKWPTNGRLVSKFSKSPHGNKGINIAGKRGQAILSSASGEVVYSGSGLVGLGKLIIVKHSKTYLSAYAHNDRILVKEGDKVNVGQKIALMGDSGSEQVLLHFEIRKNGKPVDPLKYLNR